MASQEFIPTGEKIRELTSRFSRSRMYRTENGEDFFETYYFSSWPYNVGDNYHTVSPGEEGRLDLISFEFYNTPELWWVIAEVNDISHPLKDVVAGIVLRVPSFDSLFQLNR